MAAIDMARDDELAGLALTVTYPRDLGPEEIELLLPHRGEILFARHMRLLGPEHYQGFVTWDISSMGIAGHFPSLSIVPAVYLVEAGAQIAGAGLLADQPDRDRQMGGRVGVLAGMRRCTFTRPALPEQRVEFDITVRRGSGDFVFVEGSASVEHSRIATLDLILAFPERSRVFPP